MFILNNNSSIAAKITASNSLKRFIIKNKETLIKDKCIPNPDPDKESLTFNNDDSDLYSCFHGYMLKNIYVDKNGYLNMRLEDFYNFNPNRGSWKGKLGKKLQDLGGLIPYYIIVVIKIPPEIWQTP